MAASRAQAQLMLRRTAWLVYLGAAAAFLPVYFFVTHGLGQRLLFYAYGLSSVAAIVVGVRKHRPQRRGPWLAFAVGLTLFVAGDIAFDLYALGGNGPPVPSIADVLYLAAYPVLAWGMVLLARSQTKGGDLAAALDGVIVAVGVGVGAWVFLMAPYANDHTLGVAARIVPILYPALDLLLVAVAVRLVLSRAVGGPAARLLGGAIVALLISDGLFGVADLNNAYTNGGFVDLGWLVSYVLWGAAALHGSMPRLTGTRRMTQPGRSRLALAGLALAALAPPVMLVVHDVRGRSHDVTLLAAMSAVIFLLALTRVGLLTRAIDQAYRSVARAASRQRVLTDAAVALVGAGDAEAVARAAVRAAAELAEGSGAWVLYAVASDNGLVPTATVGAVPVRVREAVGGGAIRLAEGDRSSGIVTLDGEQCHAGLVTIAEDLRAAVIVGGVKSTANDFVATLRLLCGQVGLALQTAQATEARLRARNERKFRTLIQHSSDVVTLVDTAGLIRYESAGVEAMLGALPDEHIGAPVLTIVHPDDVVRATNQFEMVLAAGHGASARLECRVAHREGRWCDIETIMTNLLDEPDVGAVVMNSRDVTVRRALERELTRQAFHDNLTDLANRALFVDRVGHALDRADRGDDQIAVVFFDLDDFKLVNNSLGHPAGDALLVAVAERVRTTTRPGDTIARFGGDEFAVLLDSGEMPETAERIGRRVIEALGPPFDIGGQEVTVRASVGIAVGRPGGQSADDLIRDADVAMFMAKRSGKGRLELFRPAMHDDVRRRLETAAELRRAIEVGEIDVAYQPIVGARDSSALGVEALARWHHPSRGLVLPLEFIAVAESTGLIVPLGKRVLAEACRQAHGWRVAGVVPDDFYLSVNLSARQLQDSSVVDDVAEILDDSQLRPESLVLEITETAIMLDFETARSRLRALKELGVRLAVDDFGTGYSSLSYLGSLPVDMVKIDKSFIDRLTSDDEGLALVRSVIDLSRALGLRTIAEGVEDAEQLSVLDTLGCDNVQGFLFAQPVSAGDMAATLQRLDRAQIHRPAMVGSAAVSA